MRLDARPLSLIRAAARGRSPTSPASFWVAAALALAALAATLALVLPLDSAHGANFDVNSSADLGDANPGDGVCEVIRTPGICTLRAAVQEANALDGDDTIALPASTFTLTIAGAGENAAATGDLDVTDIGNKLTIIGAGATFTTINGGGIDRVFHVLSFTTLELSGVTITDGNAGANGGGGIFNGGVLTLTDSKVTNSTAGNGGGIYNRAGESLPLFLPAGTATLMNVVINNNSVAFDGGGIWNGGTLSLTATSMVFNTAQRAGGLANASGALLTVSGGSFQGNSGGDRGGGIWNDGGTMTLTNSVLVVGNGAEDGGGIYHVDGSASLTNTTISDNTAVTGNGGGIYVRDFPDELGIPTTLAVTNSTINDNTASRNGGGIYHFGGTLTLTDSTVTDNDSLSDGDGGGIWTGAGIATVMNSQITINTAGTAAAAF